MTEAAQFMAELSIVCPIYFEKNFQELWRTELDNRHSAYYL